MHLYMSSTELYEDKYDMRDTDTCVYLNDNRDSKVSASENLILMKIAESIKFKIASPYLDRSIEIFQIKHPDYFSTISTFHLPCVRGYYDGDNVYMLPSCVTSIMTHLNIDYKYFSNGKNSRSPVDIINRYRTRGFGTLINTEEKNSMVTYNSEHDVEKKMFGTTSNKIFGGKVLGDEMFKPGKHINGFPDDMYYTPYRQTIHTYSELQSIYTKLCDHVSPSSLSFLLNLTTIDDSGYVRPVKSWYLDSAYDYLN